jgi:flagellar motor switch/type III secretory pathway protein FliN
MVFTSCMGTAMSVLAADFVQLVIDACRSGQRAAAVTLGDVWGKDITLEVREPLVPDQAWESKLPGPACFVVFEGERHAAVLVIPTNLPFLPPWFSDSQQVTQRMDRIAHQLHILLPDLFKVTHSWALWVPRAGEALLRAGITPDAQAIVLEAAHDSQSGQLLLVWPCQHVDQLLLADIPTQEREFAYATFEEGLRRLPAYMRSLLRIRVAVRVILASTNIPLAKLLQIAPGAIITFKKPCDSTLDLEVGGHVVAVGEVVRVGNRFGLWITSMAMPQARFHKVVGKAAQRAQQAAQRAQQAIARK